MILITIYSRKFQKNFREFEKVEVSHNIKYQLSF